MQRSDERLRCGGAACRIETAGVLLHFRQQRDAALCREQSIRATGVQTRNARAHALRVRRCVQRWARRHGSGYGGGSCSTRRRRRLDGSRSSRRRGMHLRIQCTPAAGRVRREQCTCEAQPNTRTHMRCNFTFFRSASEYAARHTACNAASRPYAARQVLRMNATRFAEAGVRYVRRSSASSASTKRCNDAASSGDNGALAAETRASRNSAAYAGSSASSFSAAAPSLSAGRGSGAAGHRARTTRAIKAQSASCAFTAQTASVRRV